MEKNNSYKESADILFVDDIVDGDYKDMTKELEAYNKAIENRKFDANNITVLGPMKMSAKSLDNVVTVPCKIGDKIYKICPKCNPDHCGSCQNCAWQGQFGPCDVGVHIYSDGSYTKHDLQIIEKTVNCGNITTVYDNWNVMFFEEYDDALQALLEYDKIRKIEDKQTRVKEFNVWLKRRKYKNPLRRD